MDIRYRLCGFLEEQSWAACLDWGGADGEKTEGGRECEGENKKQLVVLSRCQKGTGGKKRGDGVTDWRAAQPEWILLP